MEDQSPATVASPPHSPPSPNAVAAAERGYQAESEAVLLYRALAEHEPDTRQRDRLQRIAVEEQSHAHHWAAILRQAGYTPPEIRMPLRGRLLVWIARHWGIAAIAPFLAAEEAAGALTGPGDRAMVAQERGHARVFAAIAHGGGIAEAEPWHRQGALNLRAAIFGINDGIMSNLSLVVGMAGAQGNPHLVLIAGLAGLLAGAFSMAAGEYVSVGSQREVFVHQLELERVELATNPADEARELALIYEDKGLAPADAARLAAAAIADPTAALDTLAREELGLNPQDLGSPRWAAGSSFVSFALGAVVPVLPFLSGQGGVGALLVSVGSSGLALFLVGALLAVLTGRSAWRSGLRMLGIGALAATVTYLLGHLLGAAVGT